MSFFTVDDRANIGRHYYVAKIYAFVIIWVPMDV